MSRQGSTAFPLPASVRFGLPTMIVPVVVVCFLPVLHNDFVNWDDPFYFASNPQYRGLSLTHLQWMFTTTYMGHYQPLSWLTHGVVYAIWGMDPTGYHLINLALHAANAVLFSLVIVSLLRHLWQDAVPLRAAAILGALVFAIHPLRVEAVAWATERQEVLAAFFYLATLLAYLRMSAAQAAGHPWRAAYALSVCCFALSLLSKAVGIMLPIVLVILDVYPLRRLVSANGTLRKPVVVEKIPYVAVALGAGVLLRLAKRPQTTSLAAHGVMARVAQSMYGLCFYLWKTLVPVQLSPLYMLHKPLDPAAPQFVVAAIVVMAVTAAALRLRHRYPWLLAAWAAYVAIVFPVLGLGQSGPQLVADRYSYLSCLPWAVLAAAGLHWLWCDWMPRVNEVAQVLTISVLMLMLAGLGAGTYALSGVWKDSVTLWTHVIAIEPDNSFAYYNRGEARERSGDVRGALADFDQAVRFDPHDPDAFYHRAKARQARGDVDGALADYDQALRRNPRHARAQKAREALATRGGQQ